MHSQKHVSCNKSISILQQTCYQLANIMITFYGFQQLVDDKSVANCQYIEVLQVDCQNLLSTGLLQVIELNIIRRLEDLKIFEIVSWRFLL